MRNPVRHPTLWLAVAALGLAGCGAGASSKPATPVPVPPPRDVASTGTTSRTTAPATSSTTTSATTPTTRSVTTGTAATSTTTPGSGGVSPAGATTPTEAAQTPQPCGSVDFSPDSSYLASGITATASDCATARAVASASQPHQFDPPPASAPVQSFTADGFTCVGSRDSSSMLAVSDYRCTRGASVVTFERS